MLPISDTVAQQMQDTVQRMRNDYRSFQEAVDTILAEDLPETQLTRTPWQRQLRAASRLVVQTCGLMSRLASRPRGQRGSLTIPPPITSQSSTIVIDVYPSPDHMPGDCRSAQSGTALAYHLPYSGVAEPASDSQLNCNPDEERSSTNE
jgi:hypothetical protein